MCYFSYDLGSGILESKTDEKPPVSGESTKTNNKIKKKKKKIKNREELDRDSEKIDSALKEIVDDFLTKILVVGVGGAGNNAISRLMETKALPPVIQTLAVNTDALDLLYSHSNEKLLIGKKITGGLGAGNDPEVGEACARADLDTIKETFSPYDFIFVCTGLGGGTGTGAAPVIAEVARSTGALTLTLCTLPFIVEGRYRMENALIGLDKLMQVSDAAIIIPNEKLFDISLDMTLTEAFKVGDEILINGVLSVAELMTKPGLVNADFADIRAILKDSGFALIGFGEGYDENRAFEAVENALHHPLLDVDIRSARGALINISSSNLTLNEVNKILGRVTEEFDSPEVEIIWGAIIDSELRNTLRATLIISGIKNTHKNTMSSLRNRLRLHSDVELGLDQLP